jgi:hypothetical protein
MTTINRHITLHFTFLSVGIVTLEGDLQHLSWSWHKEVRIRHNYLPFILPKFLLLYQVISSDTIHHFRHTSYIWKGKKLSNRMKWHCWIIVTFTTEHYKNALISLVVSVSSAFCLPVRTAEALRVFSYNSIFTDFSKNLWACSSCG